MDGGTGSPVPWGSLYLSKGTEQPVSSSKPLTVPAMASTMIYVRLDGTRFTDAVKKQAVLQLQPVNDPCHEDDVKVLFVVDFKKTEVHVLALAGTPSTTTILGSSQGPSQTRMRHSACYTTSADSHCRAPLRPPLPPARCVV